MRTSPGLCPQEGGLFEGGPMDNGIEKGYRVAVSRWRAVFVRQRGVRWDCECSDMQAFGGRGYECRHVAQVKQWLRQQYRRDMAYDDRQ
jgi:hypothetical protein